MAASAFALYLVLLVFCPLAFGTVDLWAVSWMEFLAPLCLLAYGLSREGRTHWYKVPGGIPFALLLLFMGIQLLPLPFEWVRQLSPKAAYLFEPARAVAGKDLAVPLSLHSRETLREIFRYSSYLAFYVATVQLLSDYRRLRKVLLLVAGLAGVIAFFALLQKFSSPGRIYWFRATPRTALPFGPWVSRNHFAGFMEMLIPVVIVFALHHRPQASYALPFRQRIISLFTLPNANLHILLNVSAVLMVAALFASLSRGGILSFSGSMLFLAALLAVFRTKRGGWLGAAVLVAFSLLLVSWFGWGPVISRFDRVVTQNGQLFDGRLLIWQDSLPMLQDFWRTGAGFGAFQAVFPVYKQAFVHRSIVDHAHNDFMELVAEGGVVAVVLVGWFLVSVIGGAWQRVRRRHDPLAAQLYCGAVAGMVALFIHSLTDFNMHNPANGLYFFLLCGVAVSSANSRRRWEHHLTYLPAASALGRYGTVLAAFGLLIGAGLFNGGQFAGGYYYRQVRNAYLNSRTSPKRLAAIQEKAARASRSDPLMPTYYFAKANVSEFLRDDAAARAGYAQALRLKPTSIYVTSYVGRYLEKSDPAVSALCYERVLSLDRNVAEPLKFLGIRKLKNGDRQGGLELLRQAFALEPKIKLAEYLLVLRQYQLGVTELEAILPERVAPSVRLAEYYARQGQRDKARELFRKALTYLDKESAVKAWFFISPYVFFIKEQLYEDALDVIREGTKRMPEDVFLHIKAGDAYVLAKIPYRAKEEYEKALTLDPDNQEAADKLRRFPQDGG